MVWPCPLPHPLPAASPVHTHTHMRMQTHQYPRHNFTSVFFTPIHSHCREAAIAAALAARRALLREAAAGLLRAISYCHRRGVAHCGLGPGAVVVSAWRDRDAASLLVKLDSFGLARVYSHPLEAPPPGGAPPSATALHCSLHTVLRIVLLRTAWLQLAAGCCGCCRCEAAALPSIPSYGPC